MNRRSVLRGIAGVTLGLPFLPSLARAASREEDAPICVVFQRQGNGVSRAYGEEPERFWPSAVGPLTADGLAADSDRVLSELADWAPQLSLVRGLRYGFSENGCRHAAGGAQCLTGAALAPELRDNLTMALGPSVDHVVAAACGVEPLTLFAGAKSAFIAEVLSYRGARDRRAAENVPWNAYQRMLGVVPGGEADLLLSERRRSINDLVRDQLDGLLRRDLSTDDRRKLERHLDSVRDFEVRACNLADVQAAALEDLAPEAGTDAHVETVVDQHHDLIALAFDCGYTPAATLQIGSGQDLTHYALDGEPTLDTFHAVSHWRTSDDSFGLPIDGAHALHARIDRVHSRMFASLLAKLEARDLLDRVVAVWCNDLGDGPEHALDDLPWIIAGSARGFLRTGHHVDLRDQTHNRLLATLAAAVGVTDVDGEPVTAFGDASLAQGWLPDLVA